MIDGVTVAVCTGTLYDSGGASSGYGANENITMTICPENPGSEVTILDFTDFDLDYSDRLCIYDGVNTSATLIGCYTGTQLLGGSVQASGNNPTGCVTVEFISDDWNESTGFSAAISCGLPCQGFSLSFASSDPAFNSIGAIPLCQNGSVDLEVSANFYENNNFYAQTNANTSFSWSIGGESYTGLTATQSFTEPGYYPVLVTAVDANGCTQDSVLTTAVFVSTPPAISVNQLLGDSVICLGDSVTFEGLGATQDIEVNVGAIEAGVTFLPDGAGQSFTSTVTVDEFPDNAFVTSMEDVTSICIEMEHSYLGDLEAYIECPDGSTVVLINSYDPGAIAGGYSGGGIFLGEPIDDDYDLTEGVGWNYCFSSTEATWGSMTTEIMASNTIQVGSFDESMNPNGVYLPETGFENFVGCPLNGDWTITIVDNITSDNGYIFNWGISLADYLVPFNGYTFQDSIVNVTWQNDPTIVGTTATQMTATMDTAGVYNYTFEITNNYGCTYDTTISVTVLDTAFIDVTSINGCEPLIVPFTNNSTGNNIANLVWDYGDGTVDTLAFNDAPTHVYSDPGLYSVQLSTIGQCGSSRSYDDFVEVYENPDASFVAPGFIGEYDPSANLLNMSANADTFQWFVNSIFVGNETDLSYTFPAVDCYQVMLKASNQNGCVDSTSKEVCVEGINTLYVPNAFSPDGQLGNNEFTVVGTGDVYEDLELFIFDRWGNNIFYSQDIRKGWDGRGPNGKPMEIGVYVYRIRSKEGVGDDDPIDMLGHVTLIR